MKAPCSPDVGRSSQGSSQSFATSIRSKEPDQITKRPTKKMALNSREYFVDSQSVTPALRLAAPRLCQGRLVAVPAPN